MLMNFSQRKGGGGPSSQKLRRRTGHRVTRVNDSLFVAGGVDCEGEWAHEVLRINTQNGDLNSLILDTTLALQGFSMLSLQENIYLWGGKSISKVKSSVPQYSDELLHFEGTHFSSLKQRGQVPPARSDHLSISFANKYLIIFAGHNHTTFFNDWYLLNIKTKEWKQLHPSLDLFPSSGGSMVWLSGRGILMLNQLFDQQKQLYLFNQFFQFHVNDFDRGHLTIVPIDIPQLSIPSHIVTTHLTVVGEASFLIWGGYHRSNMKQTHSMSWLVDLDSESVEQIDLGLGCCLGVQALFYKNHLHLLGGGEPQDLESSLGYRIVHFKTGQPRYKRHVCQMCKLYYDEEYLQSTREIYHRSVVQADVDYGYQTKMDNRTLQKFSSYIREQLYALILLLTTLSSLSAEEIDVGVCTVKKGQNEDIQPTDAYHYLKLSCHLEPSLVPHIVNQILLEGKMPTEGTVDMKKVSEAVMGLKLGSYRLGTSSLLVISMENSVFVLFFSCNQLEVPHNNFSVCPAYIYCVNSKGQCSSPVTRSIVLENVKPIFQHPQDYQGFSSGSNNFTLVSMCSESLKQELQFEQSSEPDTGESSLFKYLEEDHRRSVPLLQLAFLPQHQPIPIYVQGTRLSLIHLEDLLQSDFNSKILQEVQFSGTKYDREIFSRIILFHYPEEYWFKRVLIYHKGRLISHFRQPSLRVCGLVELKDSVALDITGNNLAYQKDRLAVEKLFGSIRGLKRPCQH